MQGRAYSRVGGFEVGKVPAAADVTRGPGGKTGWPHARVRAAQGPLSAQGSGAS